MGAQGSKQSTENNTTIDIGASRVSMNTISVNNTNGLTSEQSLTPDLSYTNPSEVLYSASTPQKELVLDESRLLWALGEKAEATQLDMEMKAHQYDLLFRYDLNIFQKLTDMGFKQYIGMYTGSNRNNLRYREKCWAGTSEALARLAAYWISLAQRIHTGDRYIRKICGLAGVYNVSNDNGLTRERIMHTIETAEAQLSEDPVHLKMLRRYGTETVQTINRLVLGVRIPLWSKNDRSTTRLIEEERQFSAYPSDVSAGTSLHDYLTVSDRIEDAEGMLNMQAYNYDKNKMAVGARNIVDSDVEVDLTNQRLRYDKTLQKHESPSLYSSARAFNGVRGNLTSAVGHKTMSLTTSGKFEYSDSGTEGVTIEQALPIPYTPSDESITPPIKPIDPAFMVCNTIEITNSGTNNIVDVAITPAAPGVDYWCSEKGRTYTSEQIWLINISRYKKNKALFRRVRNEWQASAYTNTHPTMGEYQVRAVFVFMATWVTGSNLTTNFNQADRAVYVSPWTTMTITWEHGRYVYQWQENPVMTITKELVSKFRHLAIMILYQSEDEAIKGYNPDLMGSEFYGVPTQDDAVPANGEPMTLVNPEMVRGTYTSTQITKSMSNDAVKLFTSGTKQASEYLLLVRDHEQEFGDLVANMMALEFDTSYGIFGTFKERFKAWRRTLTPEKIGNMINAMLSWDAEEYSKESVLNGFSEVGKKTLYAARRLLEENVPVTLPAQEKTKRAIRGGQSGLKKVGRFLEKVRSEIVADNDAAWQSSSLGYNRSQ